jgi:hypothetical protein
MLLPRANYWPLGLTTGPRDSRWSLDFATRPHRPTTSHCHQLLVLGASCLFLKTTTGFWGSLLAFGPTAGPSNNCLSLCPTSAPVDRTSTISDGQIVSMANYLSPSLAPPSSPVGGQVGGCLLSTFRQGGDVVRTDIQSTIISSINPNRVWGRQI